jgi:hypothetical protein
VTSSTEDRLGVFSRELASGNLDCIATYLADDFFAYVPSGDEPTAKDRIWAIVSDLRAAMPDMTVSIGDIEPAGDLFCAHVTVTGTHENALWGAPGTGHRITWTNPITIKPIGEAFAIRFDDIAFPDVVATLREFGMVNPPDEMHLPPPHPVSLPDFLVKAVFTGQAGDKECAHLAQIRFTEPSTRVCAACFAVGDNWPALRMCLICGFVGCCDTSTNKHMMKHYEETGHAIMRSIRMDEGWIWCYEDSAFFETSTLDRYR